MLQAEPLHSVISGFQSLKAVGEKGKGKGKL